MVDPVGFVVLEAPMMGISGKGEGVHGNGGRSGWSFLSWYLVLLEKYPVLTKAIFCTFNFFYWRFDLLGKFPCAIYVGSSLGGSLTIDFLFSREHFQLSLSSPDADQFMLQCDCVATIKLHHGSNTVAKD
ncbi:hypothetical protein CRYUN_Cryun03dG0096800 [Craigia yunnanensis]